MFRRKKRPITDYGFSDNVVETIKPVISFIERENIVEAEREIAKLTLEVCKELEEKILSPEIGNDYFFLLDLFIDENYPRLKFKDEVKDLIFEGMLIHDYGTEFGPDLDLMRTWANKILTDQ